MKSKFSLKKFLLSFSFAFKGLKILLQEEQNFRIHFLAVLLVVLQGFYFKISSTEWLIVVLISGVVISLEILNTALENLSNVISPDFNPLIGKVKDLSAAGVLVGAITAVVIYCILFLPKIIFLLV